MNWLLMTSPTDASAVRSIGAVAVTVTSSVAPPISSARSNASLSPTCNSNGLLAFFLKPLISAAVTYVPGTTLGN